MGGKPRKKPENIWAGVERKHADLIKLFEAGEDPKYLDQPMSHWNEQAERLMADMLLRASMVDSRSIIGRIASDRIMDMAYRELGQERMDAAVQLRDRCISNLHLFVESLHADPKK